MGEGLGGAQAFVCSGYFSRPVIEARQDLPEQDSPADEGVAALADAGLYRQVEVAGFVDEAADFAGRLGDVDQQGVPTTGSVVGGHEGSLLVVRGPAR
jgi:hypothetical protein